MADPEDVAMAREWAAFYKARGFQPLPSRMDDKRPLCTFADHWESLAPDDLFGTFATSNIQVMTGRYWRLLVIDLDSEAARKQWLTMGRTPATWTTQSGGGGWHLWFRLPESMGSPIRAAFLWKSEERRNAIKWNLANPENKVDVPHESIERLCDKSLVMAPPSIHPKTGERYKFVSDARSPKRLPTPADCPSWILELKPLEVPKPEFVIPPSPAKRIRIDSGKHFDRTDVIAAVRDKVGVARSWGLKTFGKPSQKGWQPCHAIGRKDERPSAAIHLESGQYVDMGSGIKMSIFDVGVALGVYATWQDAMKDLGTTHASCN